MTGLEIALLLLDGGKGEVTVMTPENDEFDDFDFDFDALFEEDVEDTKDESIA